MFRINLIYIFLVIPDEIEYGSGSGSGSDRDDEDDDDEGSGMGHYDFDPSRTNVDGHHDLDKTNVNSSVLTPDDMDDLSKRQHTINKSSTDVAPDGVPDDGLTVEENEIPSRTDNSRGSGTSTTGGTSGSAGGGGAQEMSIVRALVTYFFPIFVAWFGGLFSILL